MKKSLIIGSILLFASVNTFARNWYLANAGNDAGSGTLASPYKTITKLNAVTIAYGDNVLFKRGDTFYGSINVVAGVNYDAYGTGAKPLISGFDTLSGWVSSSGGIYYATDGSLGKTVNLVTLKGAIFRRGRYPRSSYLTYTAINANTSITGPTIPFTLAANRAQVVIKKNHYLIDKGTITRQSGGTLTYSGTSTAYPTVNFGFFVQNDLGCLTTVGDWMYDAATHRIYMYFGSAGPSGTVKASRYPILMNFSGQANVSVKNLAFEGANNQVMNGGPGNDNLKVLNCAINNSGEDGILFQSTNTVTISNNTINNCLNSGATILYTHGTIFRGNTVHNIGTIPGAGDNAYGTTGWSAYSGVCIGTATPNDNYNNIIDSNRVVSCGYNGLHVNGSSFKCSYNRVDSVCFIEDDGGAIYTNNASAYVYSTRIIDHNIVSNTLGAPQGTDGAFGNQGSGIFLDDGSSQVTVSNNTSFNNGRYGIFLHNVNNIALTGNTFYNNPMAQVAMIHDHNVKLMSAVNLSGNKLIATGSQLDLQFRSSAANSSSGDIYTWGTATGNRYASTNTPTGIFKITVTGLSLTNVTFAQWAAATGKESGSTYTPVTENLFLYNSTLKSTQTSLVKNYIDLSKASFPQGTLAMPPFISNFLVPSSNTFTFSPISAKTYGTADFGPGATSPSAISYTSSNPLVATIVSGKIHTIGLGVSTITATSGGKSLTQVLTVTRGVLTITAHNASKIIGSTITGGPGSTAFTATGLANGQTIGSVTISYGIGSQATAGLGNYLGVVFASAAKSGTFKAVNYTITYVAGNLLVANAPLKTAVSQTGTLLASALHATTSLNMPLTVAVSQTGTLLASTMPAAASLNAPIISNSILMDNGPVVKQAVSPNGDGINDVLFIDNIENYPDNNVILTNRGGVEIFTIAGYDNHNKVFDGHSNINRAMQKPGTYFYLLEYKVNGELRRKTGYFIIRY
jgi:gliding motility-associated-like protein